MYIRKDGYYRLAKQRGYRSRASFKLIQLNHSYGIIHKNDNALDIGASPGGWMQVTIDIIGRRGTAVGIDVLEIPAINAANAVTIKGDINDPAVRQKAVHAIGRRFDVVLSDLSLNLTGDASSDAVRHLSMAGSILSFLPELLKEGGNFLIKLFYSNESKMFLKQAGRYFETVYTTKPKASRSSSSELYMAGKGFIANGVKKP